jgi:hypothetical protein
MIEYDTKNFNAGFQLFFLKHIAIQMALINFNSIAGGINFKVQL